MLCNEASLCMTWSEYLWDPNTFDINWHHLQQTLSFDEFRGKMLSWQSTFPKSWPSKHFTREGAKKGHQDDLLFDRKTGPNSANLLSIWSPFKLSPIQSQPIARLFNWSLTPFNWCPCWSCEACDCLSLLMTNGWVFAKLWVQLESRADKKGSKDLPLH